MEVSSTGASAPGVSSGRAVIFTPKPFLDAPDAYILVASSTLKNMVLEVAKYERFGFEARRSEKELQCDFMSAQRAD